MTQLTFDDVAPPLLVSIDEAARLVEVLMAFITKRITKSDPRYDVLYRSPDGRAITKSFTRKADAVDFQA